MSPEVNGPSDLEAAGRADHLAFECWHHGRTRDAVDYFREALALRERCLGADHPDVANGLVILAGAIRRDAAGDPEAEPLWQRAADIYESHSQALSPEHPFFRPVFGGLTGTLSNLARAAADRGDLDRAESLYRDVLELHADCYGPDHPVPPAVPDFARVLKRKGKHAEAEALLRAAVERLGTDERNGWLLAECRLAQADLCAAAGPTEGTTIRP